jgi:branched-chain amino acid transport system substrate-binding protein
MKKSIIWAVIIVVVVGALVWTGSREPQSQSNEVVRIGAIYAASGASAKFGELSIQGVRDAVEYFKETTGNPAEVIIEDSAGDPKQGVSAATKLFSTDKVKFMVTGTSAISAAVAPVAESAKALLISDAALLGLTKDKFYTLQNFMPSLFDIPTQINNRAEWEKVAIVYINDEFGNVWEKNIKVGLDQKKTVQSFSFEKTVTDYRTESAKVKQFGPDVAVVIGYGPALNQVLADFTLIKVDAPIIGYLDCTLPGLLADKRFSLEGQYSYEYPSISNVGIKKWMQGRGRDTNTFYTLAFENTLLALDAARQANGDVDKAIVYLKTNKFPGLWGETTFGTDGVINRDLIMNKIENSACVPVK